MGIAIRVEQRHQSSHGSIGIIAQVLKSFLPCRVTSGIRRLSFLRARRANGKTLIRLLLGNTMVDALLNESGFELGHLHLEGLLCIKRAILRSGLFLKAFSSSSPIQGKNTAHIVFVVWEKLSDGCTIDYDDGR